MEKKYILILCCIILCIIFLIYTFQKFYQNGKKFHSSDKNTVYYFSFNTPNDDIIDKCINCLIKYGTRLNPNKNFNNAKGIKMNYNLIKKYIPELIDFYLNSNLKKEIKKVFNTDIHFAPISEQYRIFLRLYLENDFIDYHYDLNLTAGDRYTIVIPILVNDKNTSEFYVKDKNGGQLYKIPENSGILYNGTNTYHSISKQSKGGLRLVVVIPMYTNYKMNLYAKARKYARDLIYKNLTL